MNKNNGKVLNFNEISDKSVVNYVESILNGKLIAGKWTKLACKRFKEDFSKLNIYFSEISASHVVKFFEKYLSHSKGEWAGQSLILEPWEKFILYNIFGWKNENGLRRFRTGYIECGRKNGKSLLLSGIGSYCFLADGEEGGEVYSAAVKLKQAEIVFGEAKKMIKKSSVLSQMVTFFKTNMSVEKTGSKFEPVVSESETLDGLNISCGLIDELHAHPNRDLWDVFETATGARRQPLQVAITTAGFDRDTVCWTVHDYTEKILERVIDDDSFFGVIYAIDIEDKDKWEDESLWIKANPNLGVSVKLDDLQRKAKRAKEIPSQLNAFLQKHLDVWTEAAEIWIPLEIWDTCMEKIDEESLLGQQCWGAIDLSSRDDITAIAYMFTLGISNQYKVIFRFFIPEMNIAKRVRKDRVPYDVWVREGFITATSGNVIDYSYILNQIDEDVRKFDILGLKYDPHGATKFIQDLQMTGFEDPKENKNTERPLEPFTHTYTNFTVPMLELPKLLTAKEIIIQKNPVLRWMASNIVCRLGAAGGMMPDKAKSREKIDGVVSLLMSLDSVMRYKIPEEPLISVF